MILMGEFIEKLEVMDERLRFDQQCKNVEQKWYENKQMLFNMLRDASNNNFIELLVTVNTTLQPHQRFLKLHNLKHFLMKSKICF